MKLKYMQNVFISIIVANNSVLEQQNSSYLYYCTTLKLNQPHINKEAKFMQLTSMYIYILYTLTRFYESVQNMNLISLHFQ